MTLEKYLSNHCISVQASSVKGTYIVVVETQQNKEDLKDALECDWNVYAVSTAWNKLVVTVKKRG